MTTKKTPKEEKPAMADKKPSERLDEIGIDAICDYVANGDSLRSWCLKNKFSQVTTLSWINADSTRAEHYAHARDARADVMFDEMDEVSELATVAETQVQVAGLRLKADNIKWKLARMNRKKYGEKMDIDQTITTADLTDEELDRRLAEQVLKHKNG